ncbi:hypothetical protein RA276_28400, partial [Pseudomonas syringae pv. tagetis]|uniref:hypothetical protein n=1 Tax=Pseudomonas syringae group genomosp. 7 TaxID=251699 RepID=UPI00376FF4DC
MVVVVASFWVCVGFWGRFWGLGVLLWGGGRVSFCVGVCCGFFGDCVLRSRDVGWVGCVRVRPGWGWYVDVSRPDTGISCLC